MYDLLKKKGNTMDTSTMIIIGVFAAYMIVTRLLRAKNRISATNARDMISNGALLLDVRQPSEYRSTHIKKAINLPLDRIDSKIGSTAPNKAADIIVYCQSGARSNSAFRRLKSLGYTNVKDLGGIASWPYDRT